MLLLLLLLLQIAVNPLMLYPVTRLGEDAQLTIKDSSDYAGLQESMSFWQLVARCQELGDVLLGYYAIPEHLDEPLNTVVDPIGMQVSRLRQHLWTHTYHTTGHTEGLKSLPVAKIRLRYTQWHQYPHKARG